MIQHVTEGGTVLINGYKFTTTNLRIHQINDKPTVRFTGKCTRDACNDAIRGMIYNGGTYGGNNLVYTWDEDTPEYSPEVNHECS